VQPFSSSPQAFNNYYWSASVSSGIAELVPLVSSLQQSQDPLGAVNRFDAGPGSRRVPAQPIGLPRTGRRSIFAWGGFRVFLVQALPCTVERAFGCQRAPPVVPAIDASRRNLADWLQMRVDKLRNGSAFGDYENYYLSAACETD
jgi:hypothetical protein